MAPPGLVPRARPLTPVKGPEGASGRIPRRFPAKCPPMLVRRLHRRVVTWLVALCVLFAQTAAVAYACERGRAAPPPLPAATHCGGHVADDVPAAGGALAQGNVCEVHCVSGSLTDPGVPDLPGPDAFLAWPLPPVLSAAAPPPPADEIDARVASPPPLALFARLLI